MSLILSFFSGMFLANGVPHFVKGITGQTHMTPFKRVSNSYLNVIWAFVNFSIGFLLMGFTADGILNIPAGINFWVFIAGAFVMSMMDAQLFSKPNARLPWQRD